MTRDEIIKMAREAGFVDESFCRWGAYSDDLERFAALVEQHLIASGYRKCAVGQRTTQFCGQLEQAVLAEREACAEVCEQRGDGWLEVRNARTIDEGCMHSAAKAEAIALAAAIRARGEK